MNFYEIQRELYTGCVNALTDEFTTIKVFNTISSLPAEFPCVSIVFNNAPSTSRMRTNDGNSYRDFYVNVDVYTNSKKKKIDAENISSFVQDYFCNKNFEVESDKPVSGINDATIYRISITFIATVCSDGTIFYRR